MEKFNLLFINFSSSEYKQVCSSLKHINLNVSIKKCSLEILVSDKDSFSNTSLILLRIDDSKNVAEHALQHVKDQFNKQPIIIINDKELTDEEHAQYKISNIIDIRPLNPIFLVTKSIGREVESQLCSYSLHLRDSQFENETYRFEAFIKHTDDGFALIHNGQYWSINNAYKRIFNIPEHEEIINTPVLEFSSETSTSNGEQCVPFQHNTSLESIPDETVLTALVQTRSKKSVVTTLYKTHCFVKGQLCTQLLIHNPNAWSNINKGVTDLRTFDYETGLYNKRFIAEFVDQQFSLPQPAGTLALILIDDFRHISEQHSVDYINEIIREIVSLIQKASQHDDIIARHSDATFILFSNHLSHTEFLLNCQQLLIDVNNTLFGNNEQYTKLTLSIGVAYLNNRISNSIQLIAHAGKACDKACLHGGNQIHVFDSITTPLTVLADEEKNKRLIQSALEQERLHLLYQPIVDLSEKRTENYAVLLRILDDDNTHILPDNFILTAEKTGLIRRLDEWVLRKTIEQIKEASRCGLKRKFFVSLSSITYQDNSFIETLISLLKFYNINSSLLVFQINFSDIQIESTSLKTFISMLKNECGCQIAFDQIGFSQITDEMIKEYRVDYLKIDGSFSQNLLYNNESQQIIKNILSVTKRNNVKTIAKSVENANTLALLWNIGIDAVQGYFLQKPADTMRFDFDLNN